MNEKTNIQETVQADMVAQDFRVAVVIVSLVANLAIFTTWLTTALA